MGHLTGSVDLLNNVNSAEPGSEVSKNKMEAPSRDTCKEEQLGKVKFAK